MGLNWLYRKECFFISFQVLFKKNNTYMKEGRAGGFVRAAMTTIKRKRRRCAAHAVRLTCDLLERAMSVYYPRCRYDARNDLYIFFTSADVRMV